MSAAGGQLGFGRKRRSEFSRRQIAEPHLVPVADELVSRRPDGLQGQPLTAQGERSEPWGREEFRIVPSSRFRPAGAFEGRFPSSTCHQKPLSFCIYRQRDFVRLFKAPEIYPGYLTQGSLRSPWAVNGWPCWPSDCCDTVAGANKH